MIAKQVPDASVADYLVEGWFESIKSDSIVRFSTETQLLRLRVGKVLGEVDLEKVITHEGEELAVDEKGILECYPKSISYADYLLDIIIGWRNQL